MKLNNQTLLVLASLILVAQTFAVIYTCITDGSPFRGELLTPWMTATLIDFYFNVAFIAIWVIYREDTTAKQVFWVMMLICAGSIGTAAYVIYLVLQFQHGQFPLNILIREMPPNISTNSETKVVINQYKKYGEE